MLGRSAAAPVSRVRAPCARAGETFGAGTTCRAEGTRDLRPGRDRRRSLSALAVAFGVVFLAELGDKSQLIALSLAARRPALKVLAGLALAALVLQGVAALLGTAVATAVPMRLVAVVAGVGFLVSALLVLRSPDDGPAVGPSRYRSTVLLAFVTLLAAELGDKTMIATAALAAREPALPVWLGATAGLVAADALAVLVGARLLLALPVAVVRRGTAVLLAVIGVVLLLGAR
jgi:Ca2+/H+ antiporter, TMEM165/GDT1 family